jgi:hypothetical protein
MNLIYNVFFTSSLILIPVFSSSPTVKYGSPVATTTPAVVRIMPVVKSLPLNPSQIAIREKVSVILGKDMVSTIQCESNFRQFDSDGTPLTSRTSDVGVAQINQVHWARAKSLGLDIFNSENDNIIMAKIILEEQGQSAWTCHAMVDT